MKLESEMNTARMISQIDQIASAITKAWMGIAKTKIWIENSYKISWLLQFLLEEKNAIEYMQDDMRECGKK